MREGHRIIVSGGTEETRCHVRMLFGIHSQEFKLVFTDKSIQRAYARHQARIILLLEADEPTARKFVDDRIPVVMVVETFALDSQARQVVLGDAFAHRLLSVVRVAINTRKRGPISNRDRASRGMQLAAKAAKSEIRRKEAA